MRKRTLVGLFLCVSLLMLNAGCSKTSSTAPGGKVAVQTSDQQSNGNAASTSSDKTAGVTDNGQKSPDLFGQVKSVSGSSITLALAKMPKSQQGTKPPQNPPAAQGASPKQAPGNGGSLELTGETKTITIPDGVKITTGGKDNSKEVSVSNIKTGDMLEVMLKDGVVSQVRVMQAPPQQ